MPQQDHRQHLCDTIVITAASAGAFRIANGVVNKFYGTNEAVRYDLLTVLGSGSDAQENEFIAENVRSAMVRHGVNRALVALPSGSQALAEKLSASGLNGLEIRAFDLVGIAGTPSVPFTERLAVTCMDWRQYGTGGIITALERRYGLGPYGFCTMAGGAKWLTEPESPRGSFLITKLAQAVRDTVPLTRINLLIHEDCGAYGGSGSFTNAAAQAECLRHDALVALENVRPAIAAARWGAKVTVGIVEIRDNRVIGIRNP